MRADWSALGLAVSGGIRSKRLVVTRLLLLFSGWATADKLAVSIESKSLPPEIPFPRMIIKRVGVNRGAPGHDKNSIFDLSQRCTGMIYSSAAMCRRRRRDPEVLLLQSEQSHQCLVLNVKEIRESQVKWIIPRILVVLPGKNIQQFGRPRRGGSKILVEQCASVSLHGIIL